MNIKKFYAVRNGKKVGIYDSWQECEANIKGYSGADYKSFSSIVDAETYLKGEDISQVHIEDARKNNMLIAYIDGSFDNKKNIYSYGCVIITPEGQVIEKMGSNNNVEALSSRNVAGELEGVMFFVKWAYDNGYKKILIRYDYEGIEKWFNKEWTANAYCSLVYVDFMKKYKSGIDIKFEKIKAHAGDKYNERADELAKNAINGNNNLKGIANAGPGYFTVKGILIEDIDAILDIINESIAIKVSKKAEGTKTTYTVEVGKEKVVIINYENGKSTVLQGKNTNLFNTFINYLTELLDVDDITPTLNEYYNVDIKSEQVDLKYMKYLGNVENTKITPKMDNTLHQAIYNLDLNGNMYDYTFLVTPALRALEWHIKQILLQHNISLKENNFNMFSRQSNNSYKLVDKYNVNIGSPKKISYINKSYNYYHNNRHVLFHVDTPIGNFDTTKMVSTKHEADSIIIETLTLINEYYIIK